MIELTGAISAAKPEHPITFDRSNGGGTKSLLAVQQNGDAGKTDKTPKVKAIPTPIFSRVRTESFQIITQASIQSVRSTPRRRLLMVISKRWRQVKSKLTSSKNIVVCRNHRIPTPSRQIRMPDLLCRRAFSKGKDNDQVHNNIHYNNEEL